MSKTYSMPGWRVGFAVGNARLLAALVRVKSYLDYGAFTPVQIAAACALDGPDDCIKDMRETYQKRRDVLISSFARAGWDMPRPYGTMFAWAPIPPEFLSMGTVEFAKMLAKEAHVAVAPGTGFGEAGEGFVRLALVENEHRIRQAARNIALFFDRTVLRAV
jgi:alanine-synthesizing transaminase